MLKFIIPILFVTACSFEASPTDVLDTLDCGWIDGNSTEEWEAEQKRATKAGQCLLYRCLETNCAIRPEGVTTCQAKELMFEAYRGELGEKVGFVQPYLGKNTSGQSIRIELKRMECYP